MKRFGVQYHKFGIVESGRRSLVLSISRLSVVWFAAAGVILLIAAFVVHDIYGKTEDRYFQERANFLAGELAYGLEGLVQESIAKVDWVTLDPQVVQALKRKDPAQIKTIEARLAKQFPELVRVRLIPAGTVDSMEGGIFPKLGFADLEMLKAGESSGKPPPIEAHFFGMEMAHVDVVRPVRDDGGTVIGQLLFSYGGTFVQRALDRVTTTLEFAEIRQNGGDKHAEVVLARRGKTDLIGMESGYTVPVIGTRWEVTYWPVPAEQSKFSGRGTLLWMVFFVIFLLMGLIAFVLYRVFNKVFQADFDIVLDILRDIQSSLPAKPNQAFHLTEFQKNIGNIRFRHEYRRWGISSGIAWENCKACG